MAKRRSVIIIGGGISGLSAGCYARMNDYETRIYEMHSIPGGSCTAWRRKDYTFDPCIEWLWGTGSHTISNRIWRELGAFDNSKVKNFDVFNTVKNGNGGMVKFYVDPDALEAHLKEISPEDAQPIETFCNNLRTFSRIDFDLPLLVPMKLMKVFTKLKFIKSLYPYFKAFGDAEDEQLSRFVTKFKNPFLRKAFRYIFFQDHVVFPMFPYYTNMAAAIRRNAGFPEGGSLAMSLSIERRFKDLGGEISYNRKVSEIIVRKNRAVGVRFDDGVEDYADIIVSASDGRSVIYDMLGGRYRGRHIDALYGNFLKEPIIYNGIAQVFLGVSRDMSDEPHSITYLLSDSEKAMLPAILDDSMVVQIRTNYYRGFAPPGKSVISMCYLTDYDFWKPLYAERELYNRTKNKITDFITEYLDKVYPGLKKDVEVTDVSTPVTLERYTGNHRGSIMAWKPFTKAEKLGEKFIKGGMRLPGLKNFYMTGQWTLVGGLIRASSLGRYVVQFMCRDDGKKFRTSEKVWHESRG